MDAIQAILTRRSIRQYTQAPVPTELVETLLRAASSAPSAGNRQPWQFAVIRDRAKLDAIPGFHPHAEMVRSARLAILVCADASAQPDPGYWVQDCSAAMQNLLLAAHAQGLGAVWVGVYPEAERMARFRQLLNVPPEVIPFALVPLGYPAETQPPSNRYQAGRIHADGW